MAQKQLPRKTVNVPAEVSNNDLITVRVTLTGDDEIATAALVEERLYHLRQLFAVSFLLRVPVINEVEMLPMIALILSATRDIDLEDLVPLRVQIRTAGTGTFWADLFVQMVAHLPTGADLKIWADYLKNAQTALTAAGGIVTWLVTHVRIGHKKQTPIDELVATWSLVKDSKASSAEQKEEIRRGLVRTMEDILGPKSKGLLSNYLPPK
jgi:hypothetical protein